MLVAICVGQTLGDDQRIVRFHPSSQTSHPSAEGHYQIERTLPVHYITKLCRRDVSKSMIVRQYFFLLVLEFGPA